MSPGRRARRDEYALRINAAVQLLDFGLRVPEAIGELAAQHGISERQARRYVEQARNRGTVDVPGPKQVFTVKLPRTLVRRLKEYAQGSQRTLSSIVTQALDELLGKKRAGPRGGRSTG
jgi:DNA-binding transcriptional regulator LsrR (DeoR family)